MICNSASGYYRRHFEKKGENFHRQFTSGETYATEKNKIVKIRIRHYSNRCGTE